MRIRSKLIAALAIAAASTLYADENEKKPQVFRASFAPDATQKFADSIGVTSAPILEGLRVLETRAAFLGKGAIDTAKPFGVIGHVMEPNPPERWFDRTLEQNGALVLPINKGFTTVDNLAAFSATPNGEQPVITGNVVTSPSRGNFKRTENNLVYSRYDAYTQINDNPFANDYKTGVLASATLDLAALRKSGPKIYDGTLNIFAKATYPGRGEAAIHDAFVKLFRTKIDSIETANLVISADDKGLRAASTLTPLSIKPTLAAFSRPTFIGEPVVELHLAYPDAKSSAWLVDTIDSINFNDLIRIDIKDGPDEKQMQRIKENILRGAKLFTAAEATSAALHVDSGMVTLMMVNQYARDIDAAKELTEIAASANALAKELKTPKIMEVKSEDVGNQKLTHVLFLDRERPVFYLELAQTGRTLAIAFSDNNPVGAAGKLLAAPAQGKLDNFLTLDLNLKQLVIIASATHAIPRRDADFLKEAIGDITLTATATSDDAGKSMIIESNIPLATAKSLGGIFEKLFEKSGEKTVSPTHAVPPEEVDGDLRIERR